MNGAAERDAAAVLTLPRECAPWHLFQTVSEATLPALLASSRGDPVLGRFSIVAANPFLIVQSRAGRGTVKSKRREYGFQGDLFPVLGTELDRCRVAAKSVAPEGVDDCVERKDAGIKQR